MLALRRAAGRRRALAGNAALALQALGRCVSSSSSAAQQQQAVAIPAEVAALVSQRSGMTALPSDVEAAVAAAASDANRKAVKRRGQELAYRLRAMSRSKHRGGVHPNLSEQLGLEEAEAAAAAARRQRRGKRRQSRGAALDLLTRAPALAVRDSSRVPDLDEYWGGELKGRLGAEEAAQAAAEREAAAARSSRADGGELYDMPAVLAYAAARLPACYAALSAALGEVAGRRPGWRPASHLDFGAGPGTAVWAAQQVWPQVPLDALAVEPANAMAWLGNEIQQRQREAYEAHMARAAGGGGGPEAAAAGEAAASSSSSSQGLEQEGEAGEAGEAPAPPPRLRWMYKLPPKYREAQGRRYDLVTAGYVLGELRGDAERRRLVQQLWERTAEGGVLLLVEPGTPAGAAHIQRARSQLLEAASAAAEGSSSGNSSSMVGGSSSMVGGGQRQQPEAAHVVAPCPHDGACPMAGRPSWCHFVQRFQRTQLQRAAKASAGIQPRTYQDERYSYVAVAKAPRPACHAPAQQPLVAGGLMPSMEDPQDFLALPEGLAPRKVPDDARPLLLYSDSEGEEEEEEEGAEGELGWADAEGPGGGGQGADEASDLGDWWGEEGGEGGDAAEREAGYQRDWSSYEEEGGSETDRASGSGGEGQQAAAAAAVEAEELAGLDEATRQLLLESIADEDDEDGSSSGAGLAERLQAELAAAVAEQRRQAAAAAAAADQGPAAAAERPVVVLAPISEATADLLYDGERVDWAAAEPAAVAAAAAASGGWSRVIRTPRKRSGHVVLDLCAALPAEPAGGECTAAPHGDGSGRHSPQQGQQQQQQQEQQGQQLGQQQGRQGRQRGVLLRQTVSKAAARREAGGTAPYRLARRLRWGDLWPLHYQQAFRAEEPPAAGDLG